jgi:hypothetical protein
VESSPACSCLAAFGALGLLLLGGTAIAPATVATPPGPMSAGPPHPVIEGAIRSSDYCFLGNEIGQIISNAYDTSGIYGNVSPSLPTESTVINEAFRAWSTLCTEPSFVSAVNRSGVENFSIGLGIGFRTGTGNVGFSESGTLNQTAVYEISWSMDIRTGLLSGPREIYYPKACGCAFVPAPVPLAPTLSGPDWPLIGVALAVCGASLLGWVLFVTRRGQAPPTVPESRR